MTLNDKELFSNSNLIVLKLTDSTPIDCLLETIKTLANRSDKKDLQISIDASHNLCNENPKHICLLLQNNCFVKHFNLMNTDIDDKKIELIENALILNTTVNYLDFGVNSIAEEGAKILGRVLSRNTSLKTLSLQNNELSANACKHLFNENNLNHKLKFLDLSSNEIRCDGAKIIAKMLKENKTLKTIEIYSCRIGDEGLLSIADALQYNSTLTCLIAGRNFLSTRAQQPMCERLERNFHLLQVSLPTSSSVGGRHVPAVSLQTRLDALQARNSSVLWPNAQPFLLQLIMTLTPLDLPPYVLLEILDQLPLCDKINHKKKIDLIIAVRESFRKVLRQRKLLNHNDNHNDNIK